MDAIIRNTRANLNRLEFLIDTNGSKSSIGPVVADIKRQIKRVKKIYSPKTVEIFSKRFAKSLDKLEETAKS